MERFWSKVDIRGPDECWLWQGARHPDGYGRVGGQQAHRVALSLDLGRPIREGMCVLHSCDNRPCVNPMHLREGTNAENVQDRVRRNRSARGESHGTRTKPERCIRRGLDNGAATVPA